MNKLVKLNVSCNNSRATFHVSFNAMFVKTFHVTFQEMFHVTFHKITPCKVSRDVSGFGYMMGHSSWIIDCCGLIDKWQANFDNVGGSRTIYFQVWRPTSGNELELVGENAYTVCKSISNMSKLCPPLQRIQTREVSKFQYITRNFKFGAKIRRHGVVSGLNQQRYIQCNVDVLKRCKCLSKKCNDHIKVYV